ncbi:MAG TPA: universal stress protein [Polyangiaceae bacterium]|nr:universal stress protein [Polyangiaceae bacterium]
MSNTEKPYVIVVGIDYSAASDLALERAFGLSRQHPRAELHALNVVQLAGAQAVMDGTVVPGGFVALSLAEASAHVERYVGERSRALGDALARVQVRAYCRAEEPAHEIAQLAADLEADLVVVGTHGRRGIARLLLGSVAEAVVRLAPCPVLVVRAKALPEQAPRIEPPCPQCLEARRASGGAEFWCTQHRERHGQRHTYSQRDRVGADTEMPLTFHS